MNSNSSEAGTSRVGREPSHTQVVNTATTPTDAAPSALIMASKKRSGNEVVQMQEEKRARTNLLENDRSGRSQSSIRFTDLPIQAIDNIIRYCDTETHRSLRNVSQWFHDCSNTFLLHVFRTELRENSCYDLDCMVCDAVLRSIDIFTELYVKSGYVSTFCDCLLNMQQRSECGGFVLLGQMTTFLSSFLPNVEREIGCSYLSRLLYCLTLLRLIKFFPNTTVVSSNDLRNRWSCSLVMDYNWLTMVCKTSSFLSDAESRYNLTKVLMQLFEQHITGATNPNVSISHNDEYAYGYHEGVAEGRPKTYFSFTVQGSERICSLFKSSLAAGRYEFSLPPGLPRERYIVNLSISCRNTESWAADFYDCVDANPRIPYFVKFINKIRQRNKEKSILFL